VFAAPNNEVERYNSQHDSGGDDNPVSGFATPFAATSGHGEKKRHA
jgi:hypothetical protein